jgi:hypothetical protein
LQDPVERARMWLNNWAGNPLAPTISSTLSSGCPMVKLARRITVYGMVGLPGQVEGFIKEVRRGPSMAHVDGLDIQDIAVTGRYQTFTIEGW